MFSKIASSQKRAFRSQDLGKRRRETPQTLRAELDALEAHDLATFEEGRGAAHLTPEGWRDACSVVRNHRLWELYLTNAANYQVDHVHDDAERIEHILGEETVRLLERRLEFPHRDPHGKSIPSLRDMERFDAQPGAAPALRISSVMSFIPPFNPRDGFPLSMER